MFGSPVASSEKLFLTEPRVYNLEIVYVFAYFDFIYLCYSSCTST